MTGIEWSAKGYDAWGTAEGPARYNKISLFPEATDRYPGRDERRRAFWSALDQVKPDIVAVNGWNNFGSLSAANCCVDRGVPLVVMSESARVDEPRTWWKEIIKRRIVDLYCAALVGGQRHVEYLVELGMPRERVFTGYDVVDNHYFRQKAEEVRNQRSSASAKATADRDVRQKYGLPQNYFLASARFVEKKNLPRLIRAYAEYRHGSSAFAKATADRDVRNRKSDISHQHSPWDLVLLGDGPLKADLCHLISDLRLNDHVHLARFQAVRRIAGLLRIGECIRACQHD